MNENGTDQELSQAVGQELAGFVASLLVLLDEKLDKRLAPLSGRYRPLWNYGTIGLSSCSWSPSSTLSFCLSSILISKPSATCSCAAGATELQSGTEMSRYRFIVYVLL